MRTQKTPAKKNQAMMTPDQFRELIASLVANRQVHADMTPRYQARADAGEKAYTQIVKTNVTVIAGYDKAIAEAKSVFAKGGRV